MARRKGFPKPPKIVVIALWALAAIVIPGPMDLVMRGHLLAWEWLLSFFGQNLLSSVFTGLRMINDGVAVGADALGAAITLFNGGAKKVDMSTLKALAGYALNYIPLLLDYLVWRLLAETSNYFQELYEYWNPPPPKVRRDPRVALPRQAPPPQPSE